MMSGELGDERIGKKVGRRLSTDGLSVAHSTKENARAWHEAFGGRMVPRGVYRFNSHEEADEWMWKMLTRPKKGEGG